MKTQAVDNYIDTHAKSQGVGFILTLLFGPLGLFYSNLAAGFMMTITTISMVFVPGAFGIFAQIILWIASILFSISTVRWYNDKVAATANLIGEST